MPWTLILMIANWILPNGILTSGVVTPTIFEKEGIALTPQGVLGLTKEEVHVSLMIKVKKPKLLQITNSCDRRCSIEDITSALSAYKCVKPHKLPTGDSFATASLNTTDEKLRDCILDNTCAWVSCDKENC
jgi:hypothetical protein